MVDLMGPHLGCRTAGRLAADLFPVEPARAQQRS